MSCLSDIMVTTKSSVLALAVTSVISVSAHYNFDRLIINGEYSGVYEYTRRTTNGNGPIEDVTIDSMICNQGGLDADIRAATDTAVVQAGDQLGFNVIDILEHPGPLNVFLSKAPDGVSAQDYLGDGDWFNIYSLGARQFRPHQVCTEMILLMLPGGSSRHRELSGP